MLKPMASLSQFCSCPFFPSAWWAILQWLALLSWISIQICQLRWYFVYCRWEQHHGPTTREPPDCLEWLYWALLLWPPRSPDLALGLSVTHALSTLKGLSLIFQISLQTWAQPRLDIPGGTSKEVEHSHSFKGIFNPKGICRNSLETPGAELGKLKQPNFFRAVLIDLRDSSRSGHEKFSRVYFLPC